MRRSTSSKTRPATASWTETFSTFSSPSMSIRSRRRDEGEVLGYSRYEADTRQKDAAIWREHDLPRGPGQGRQPDHHRLRFGHCRARRRVRAVRAAAGPPTDHAYTSRSHPGISILPARVRAGDAPHDRGPGGSGQVI